MQLSCFIAVLLWRVVSVCRSGSLRQACHGEV